jgi:hypothetical protein
MKKFIVFPGIFFALGIYSIFRFFQLQNTYSKFKAWSEGATVSRIDGEGYHLTFLGIPLYRGDKGIHWSEIIAYTSDFLTAGIILITISAVLFVCVFLIRFKKSQKCSPAE